MWKACLEGIVLGLGLALLFGPAFFCLLQTSLERGFYPAMRFAFGVFISDSFLVSISFLGAARLFTQPEAKHIIGLIGGAVLIGIGIYTFRKKINLAKKIEDSEELKLPSNWTYFVKGFFMNMANPATWLFWLFWVGIITAQYTEDGVVRHIHVIAFFLSALLVVLSTDLIKAFIANKIKQFITVKTVGIVNKVVGILLGAFGFYLLIAAIFHVSFGGNVNFFGGV
ncbi:MAG: LysE family transporter [Bacteroidales bacterium]